MLDRLTQITEEVRGFDPSLLGAESFAEAIRRYGWLRSAVEAGWLALLIEADKAKVATKEGMRNTADLVSKLTGERRGSARADVELAGQLDGNEQVRDALATGLLTKDKAAVLSRVEGTTSDERAELVTAAAKASADGVRRLVAAFKASRGAEEPPMVNRLTMSKSPTRSRVVADLDPARTAMLEAALEIAAAQMKLPKDIPFEQRRAEYFVAICKYFVEHVEGAAENRVGRPHVLVMVDLDVFEGRSEMPSTLGNGQIVSGSVARRLACDSNISRIVMKGKSEVLDVGRATRSWSPAMAKAIIVRDRHCVHPGCEVPPWGCEIHHKEPYGDKHHGGVTSVDGGELRCWHHHDWEHERLRRQSRQRPETDGCDDHDHSAHRERAAAA